MSKVELKTKAPDFSLVDFNDNSISLADYFNQKNVVIVFNRGFL